MSNSDAAVTRESRFADVWGREKIGALHVYPFHCYSGAFFDPAEENPKPKFGSKKVFRGCKQMADMYLRLACGSVCAY